MEILGIIAVVLFVASPIIILVKLSGIKDALKNISVNLSGQSDKLRRLQHDIDKIKTAAPAEEEKWPSAPPAAPVAEPAPAPKMPPIPVTQSKPAIPVATEPVAAPKPVAKTPVLVNRFEPAEVSKFVRSAKEIMRRAWNWILVGEEFRNENVTTEFAIASTWLLRLGIGGIVTASAYFLKWSIEKDLINEKGRVALVMMAGVVMLIWGMRLLGKKKYRLMGEGFLGGGILTLYFGSFAAGPMYNLLGIYYVFALMIGVTITAGILSTRANSLLIAVIGIIGAYGTPIALEEAGQNLPVLYSYTFLLCLGILGIARRKQWYLLNYLGFVATYILFFWSLYNAYEKADFPIAMSFLSAFFIVHSSISFTNNIIHKQKSGTLEIVHLLANAIVFGGTGYFLIYNAHGRPYPAIMALALAVFYLAHVMVFLKSKILDRPLLITLIALAATATSWTLPLVLENEPLTIGLALLAFTFMWIAFRLKCNFIENLAYIIYLVVFYRLLVLDLERNFDFHPARPESFSVYWEAMRSRLWTFGISIVSIFATFFLKRKQVLSRDDSMIGENDTPPVIKQRASESAFYWIGILFAFVVLHLELNTVFTFFAPWRLPALTVLWCVMALYFLWRYLYSGRQNRIMYHVMCAFIIIAILKLFVVDIASWHFTERFIYNMEYSLLFAGARMLDFCVIMAILLLMWATMQGNSNDRKIAATFGYCGLFVLFVYSTFEINSLLHFKMNDFQAGGISILWALFAITFTSGGIWKSIVPLRVVGLGLFAVVIGKVILVDLGDMEVIYKVIAFLVVGVVLLLGSFAYLYSDKKFSRLSPKDNKRQDEDKQ